MKKFEIIGIKFFKDNEWELTSYFQIGELKKAIDIAKEKEKKGFSYKIFACDKYGCENFEL